MQKTSQFIIILILLFQIQLFAQIDNQFQRPRLNLQKITDSGGELSPAQAAYDVTFYDLDLSIDPPAKSIDGSLTAVV
ncbi:MAG: hypothetical protein GF353_08610, partial [Candidatus Lokiarchaeota archaeon]|nr:hypothetical protein [Candidatus Lokiarchaeota archaeon]